MTQGNLNTLDLDDLKSGPKNRISLPDGTLTVGRGKGGIVVKADKKVYVSFDPSTNEVSIRFNERHSEKPIAGKTDYSKPIDGPQPYDTEAVRATEERSYAKQPTTDQSDDSKSVQGPQTDNAESKT